MVPVFLRCSHALAAGGAATRAAGSGGCLAVLRGYADYAKSGSTADRLANAAAAGTRPPGEDEGTAKIHHAQSELPPIGSYGDDPVAALASAVGGAQGAAEAAQEASEGALGAAAEAASGAASAAAEAARGGLAEAAAAARGGLHEATEQVKPQAHAAQEDTGNVTARGEAPGTSGHAKEGWPRWKKEAEDSMTGGTPEPGVVLE